MFYRPDQTAGLIRNAAKCAIFSGAASGRGGAMIMAIPRADSIRAAAVFIMLLAF